MPDKTDRTDYVMLEPSSIAASGNGTFRATIADRRVVVHLANMGNIERQSNTEQGPLPCRPLHVGCLITPTPDPSTIRIEVLDEQVNDDEMWGYIWVDSEMLNLELVKRGYATLDSYGSHRKIPDYYEVRIEAYKMLEEACPFPTTTTTTTPHPASRPPATRQWQSNQYGCHSDGRCLDDYGSWCDEADVIYFEATGEEVCPRDLDSVDRRVRNP